MKIFSSELKCHFSSSSPRRISSSSFEEFLGLECGPLQDLAHSQNCGLAVRDHAALGEMLTSQSVNA